MSLEPNEMEDLRVYDDQAQLFEQHGRAIFAYLRLHLANLQDAEDLLLETFLAALESDNLSTFEPGRQLAWLKRVAHNKLLNNYRRSNRQAHISLDALVDSVLVEENLERHILRQEERQQLHKHLQKLSLLQRQALQMRYGDGLRCSEIALLLNKSEEAIRKILSRGILFLRNAYQQAEGERS
jgi:RNA polymerase sigma-70 factor, ECF subfamily